MSLATLATVAGSVATLLFMASTLPMLIKAGRSRDLRSYSGTNLAIANCGNVVQILYVLSLPLGPIWGIHLFNTVASLLMLIWWLRCRRRSLLPGARRADEAQVEFQGALPRA